ncbi:MAG: glycoside hydrolase [Halobacteriales archaeon]|nr:glycoside hydrolase [Halobacteriales archaeon]
MRALVLAAVLLGSALAGCVTNSATIPPAGLNGWMLDCALGASEQARNASWAQRCEARASHSAGPKEETWLAINPTDPRNVVVGAKDLDPESSQGCVWNGVFVTHDAGATWKDLVIGGKYADRQPGDPFFGYACNTDPMFQFTKDGALHYGVEMYNFLGQNADSIAPKGPVTDTLAALSVIPGWKILLATSHDGGDSWPDVVTYQQDEGVVTDFSRMTVSPTTQSILEMIGAEAGGCHVLASRDGGKTAEAVPVVPVAPDGNTPCQAIAASPKGTIVLMGFDFGNDPGVLTGSASTVPIQAARSTDDGRTWMDANIAFPVKFIPQFNESKYRVGSGLELAYDLTNGTRSGTLYATYASADRDEADVFVRSSTDDGKTWGDAVRVNGDAPGPHQWMPNVAVAGDGSVHVFFMDKRYTAEHKLIDITHAVSFDGGKTWANERVSSVPFDGDLGVHQEGFPFIGDYLGLACGPQDCWAGYPDASDGRTTVVAAGHVHRSG